METPKPLKCWTGQGKGRAIFAHQDLEQYAADKTAKSFVVTDDSGAYVGYLSIDLVRSALAETYPLGHQTKSVVND